MIDEEKIMKEWDYWREQIAAGNKSSAPRDWFESIIDDLVYLIQGEDNDEN